MTLRRVRWRPGLAGWLWLGVLCAGELRGQEPATSAGAVFFEKKIRPVLAAECYSCHASQSREKPRAGLALDRRSGLLRGGASGPAIVPGEPDRSLLIKALGHDDPELKMPPRRRLDPAVVQDFIQWVRMGAPDPRTDDPQTGAPQTDAPQTGAPAATSAVDRERGREHWSFRPLVRAAAPPVTEADWPLTEFDQFVLAALQRQGIAPSGEVEPRTLLRRAALDLTGLPPEPEEVEAFAADPSAEAFEREVDRLLASPRFGEKWARHWLDVARYAESTGKTVNFNYPHAWRYRDYVIGAFNADKPYDQFIVEQLAGDQWPADDPRIVAERQIATGFLAIGPKTLNERSGLKFELDVADEQLDVTTQAFLGVTVACARCHDHKFDPISQVDYYALAGIFRSTETCYGTVRFINAQRPAPLLSLPDDDSAIEPVERLTERERRSVERQMQTVRDSMSGGDPLQRFFASGRLALLQARLDAFDLDGTPKRLAMGVRDKRSGPEGAGRRERFGGAGGFTYDGSKTVSDSPVYLRGEAEQPSAERIPRGTLRVLADRPLDIPPHHSGRLELARWIADRDNPLTARVMADRIWRQLFGRGLVPTADDFGLAGRPPSHPELLDRLALQFMEDGWSVKRLIKRLATSRVYRLDSRAVAEAQAVDPDGRFYWRMAPRRLDAETLRDAILAVGGRLDLSRRAGSAVARSGEGPVVRPRFGGASSGPTIDPSLDVRRSIYLPIVRDAPLDALALFDAADASLVTPERKPTTVPSQALYLLNNGLVLRAADGAAERLLRTSPDEAARVVAAFARFYGRPPTREEQAEAATFLAAYRAQAAGERPSRSSDERELWSVFCQALFASAEFQYRR